MTTLPPTATATPAALAIGDVIARRGRAVAADVALPHARTVLVTGAAGSIGSAVVAHLQHSAQRVLALDQDDTGLQRLARSTDASRVVPWLANLRDRAALDRLFARQHVDLVIHCAALKHVDLLEQFPREAWATNVVATGLLASAAAAAGAALVHVSTDKAAAPTTVLGRSKRIAERLVAWHGHAHGVPAVSIRLGNVLGSRGSVLETFLERASAGEPLPVTDPRMTRWFMTCGEVLHLIGCSLRGPSRAHCVVPDLGEPVAIGELAAIVLARTGSRSAVHVVGPRPGDRLHERMVAPDEAASARALGCGCVAIDVSPLAPEVTAALPALDGAELTAAMDAWCGATAGRPGVGVSA